MTSRASLLALLAPALLAACAAPAPTGPGEPSQDDAASELDDVSSEADEASEIGTAESEVCASVCDAHRMIIGWDDRTQKSAPTEGIKPWSYVGRFGNGCTGTLIGPNKVLSAAHCFLDGSNNFKSGPISFSLGQTSIGPCGRPYGNQYVAHVTIPEEYNNGSASVSNKSWDYAVVSLNASPAGAEPMPYGYTSWSYLETEESQSIGYPSTDKTAGTLWDTGRQSFLGRWINPTDSNLSGVLYVDNDGEGGQSGSPVFYDYLQISGDGTIKTAYKLTGVLIGSPVSECQAGRLWAARILPDTVDRIDTWKADPDSLAFPRRYKQFTGTQIKPAEPPPDGC